MNQFLKHEGVRKYPSISKLPTGGMYQSVKGMIQLRDFYEILDRAHLQKIRAFLDCGCDTDNLDLRPYEQRRQEGERPIYEFLEKQFPDEQELDLAVEKLSYALIATRDIYMEIGMKAGARLVYQLLWENQPEDICPTAKQGGGKNV